MSGDGLVIVLGTLLVGVAAGFTLLPLVAGPRPGSTPDPAAPGAASDVERQRLYAEVLELEFDHRTGKLSAEDYLALSSSLLARAADLLHSPSLPDTTHDDEDEIERAIAAARRALAAPMAAGRV